ncbi:MAG TPA: MG2 domain-containing protein [Kofleriaceae bacterium]|nr:MG2 domain-containing protein [Kofleriaceae bacterium]
MNPDSSTHLNRRSAAVLGAWLLVSTAATLALGVLSCSGRQQTDRDLVVASFSPEKTGDGQSPIQIPFDRPVVDAAGVGPALTELPVVLEPAADVRGHWRDRQTLVLTPTSSLARSTRYKVTLGGELARRTGGFSFEFVNQPLEVEGVWGVDLAKLPPRPELPLHFNQEVAVDDVLAHCRIRAATGDQTVRLETDAARGDSAASITVRPGAALEQGQTFTLVCDRIAGLGGNAELADPYVLELRTYPGLGVSSVAPDGWDVPADEVDFTIVFSTPVTLEAARKHISIAPVVPGFDNGWLDNSGTRYRVTANLKTETPYELQVGADLRDIYDQPLGKARTHSFRTGDAQPRLTLETGIYAVETRADGYPVWTRNVKSFDVECAAVPKSKVVSLLTSGMDYDPWYDAEDPELDWKDLGLKQRERKVTVEHPKNKWHLTNLSLKDVCGGTSKRGLYLASLSSDQVQPDDDNPWRYHPHRRVLANVTDLGLLTKAGTASGLVWVTSIDTGKPVAGAAVSIYTPQGRKAFTGKTDAHGLLKTPGTTKLLEQPGSKDDAEDVDQDFWSYRSQRLIVVAEHGGDLAVVDGNWANGIQTWNFGVPEDRQSGLTRIRGFIQSDRGIYRPGETVHFKGIVREIDVGKGPRVPARTAVDIEVEDSRGSTIHTAKKKLTRYGGFDFDLALPAEANLGDYYVRATVKGQTFRERFMVEEFRKVTYEVAIKGDERNARLGDKLAFKVSADYLFGAPVVGAAVEWNLQRRPHRVSFPRYRSYTFADYASRGQSYWYSDHYRDNYLTYISDGTNDTDKNGKLTIQVRDPQTNFDGPQDYVVHASVTDDTDQTTSKQAVITAHRSDFYLGVHSQEYVQAVGKPFSVNLLALDPAGKPVAARATLSMIRQDWQCTYSDGYRSYQSCTAVHKPAMTREVTLTAGGEITERIMPEHPGEYIVRIEGTDARGNKVAASDYVWILGKGEAFWSGDESARMTLISSKPEYQPGETARLVPRTDLKNATALISLERNGILEARVAWLKNPNEGIELPLTDAHAPNVFASVAMVTGRKGEGDRNRPRFKMGVIDLKVSPDAQRLKVEVKTERAQYQPGEKVTGTLVVTAGGKPVQAELSLSVADEGVLQLIAYKTPDPMLTFYQSWGLGIDNSTNWNRIARLNDPSAIDPDEGGDDGGESGQQIRSRFVSSAYWKPNLVTDAEGKVGFSFTAPDNLTAFRLMAVAADTGSRFGSADARITIKKPLLAKPVVPRFANAGDTVEVGVVVHNYTGAAGTATVTARVKGGTLAASKRTVKLANDGSARVGFGFTPADTESARLTFSVKMGAHSDALALDVPISRGLVKETRSVARGALVDGASAPHGYAWSAGAVTDASMLSVTVDRTGLSELEPSLRYLIEYPYGCLEQTLSRFIPLTKVKDLAESMSMRSLQGPKMNGFIRAGAAKVVRHQHADGHYSLWPSGPTYPHLTVYATYGLAEARRAGVAIDEDAMNRGLAAIRSWANATERTLGPGGETGTVAMAAYLLAESGKPDAGLNARLYQARAGMPRYGQAFLLRALHRSKAPGAQIATVQHELTKAAVSKHGGLLVRETGKDEHEYMSSDARSTAILLSALLEVAPTDPHIDQLVAGLKAERLNGGHWRNTQDNLYALVALADYGRVQAAGSSTVSIHLGGEVITRTLTGGQVLAVSRSLDTLKPGSVEVRAKGKVRYAVSLTEARRDPATTPSDNGFTVTRQYLDPASGLALTSFKAGQLVKVAVVVKSASDRSYVAVQDPIPAGFEAVNTRLATSQGAPTGGYGYRWRNYYGFVHTELRDDRVLGFADRMRAGELTLEYLARATIPGTFKVLPAHAEEMYRPEVNGRTAGRSITVSK